MSSNSTPLASKAAGEYVSLTRRPASSFITTNIPAPTDSYCSDDSFIRVTAFAFTAAAQVSVDYFILRSSDGDTSTGEEVLSVPNAGVLATKDIQLTEGFLLGVTIKDLTGSAVRGNVFITAQLMRGSSQSNRTTKLLFADYAVANQPTGYPFGRTTQSIDGRGSVVFSAFGPALAGAEALIGTTAVGQRYSLHMASLTFVASATVANRIPEIRLLRNGVSVMWRIPYPGTITAGQTFNITLMSGGPSPVIVGSDAILPLPQPTILLPADTIQTVTAGIQAGDQYTVVNHSGEAWVNG